MSANAKPVATRSRLRKTIEANPKGAAPAPELIRRVGEAVDRAQRKQKAEQEKREKPRAERGKRVTKAIEVISKDRADKTAIERSVRFVEEMSAYWESQDQHPIVQDVRPRSKEEKRALASVARALRKVQTTLKTSHLPRFVRDYFPHTEIEQWRSCCERGAKVVLGKPKRRDAFMRRVAAEEAACLLKHHDLPVSGSRHERLTAALYGDPGAKLTYASRLAKSAKPGLI